MALVFSAVLIWDVYERSIPPAFEGLLTFRGLMIPNDRLMIICIALIVLLVFWLFMTRTRHGLAMRAAAQDVETAESQGINTSFIYRLAFFIAIFMAALAGGLYAQTYSLSPFVGEQTLMVAFVVVVLGGMGSIPGAALGGVILGFSESFISTFYGAAVSSFVSFGVVIILLILRPWGLLGTPESERS
jgi:branched-chain amino acid transport system permease protein